MITGDELIGFLLHQLPYEQKIVSYVDSYGLQHQVNKFADIPDLKDITLKIEGMEKYSKEIWSFCKKIAQLKSFDGPVTAHCFYAHPQSPSFGIHKDLDDVMIYCVEGVKTLYVEDTYYELQQGESVFIQAGTPHEITNRHSSIILSIGFEKYMVDKL
jgi:mannose-6-phosphate isomerase-like protein (cupin superfamily)